MRDIDPVTLEILRSKLQAGLRGYGARIEVDHVDLDTSVVTTVEYRPLSVDLDKSLTLAADQAIIVLPWTAAGPEGWGDESVFQENSRVRVYQWYGDRDNEFLAFTGLIDYKADSRDPGAIALQCRDMMALLIDQTFSTTAPQTAGETGAVRTQANGVYLSIEVADIVTAILNAAGWPTDDRDVTDTSYVVDEFIVADGASWADTIAGEGGLADLVGYRAYADEDGVFHFGPSLATSSLTEVPVPDYIYHSGVDLVSLLDATDQDDLVTRVKVRGPLTTQVLTDEWREIWRTSKIHQPVGVWFDPTDTANLRVVDGGTNRLYKLRQSDRVVLSSVDISAIAPHPLGLSGDPADDTVYWILNAPWIDGGSGGNRVKKVRKSDNHVLLALDLPDGQISALKVSASYLYYTRLDTDRVYKRDKTDGSAVSSFQHTYNGVLQANPSGLMIDGTTLMVFWANGGTTARFLHCEESAPGTITKVTRTAGTALHGGEMDTVTHRACYGDSDSLGLVAKFSLVAVSERTDEVYAEVVNSVLEDELGALAQSQDRVHDTHPDDLPHPFEVRRLTLDIPVVTSLAQATETASRKLDLLGQFRRVLDFGIPGNPALQKTDILGVVDPVTGLNTVFSIDTYRTSMSEGTFLGVVAGVKIPDLVAEQPPITDDGSADEDPETEPTDVFITLLAAHEYDTGLGFQGTGDAEPPGDPGPDKTGPVSYVESSAPFFSIRADADMVVTVEAAADYAEVASDGDTIDLEIHGSVQGAIGIDHRVRSGGAGFWAQHLSVSVADVTLVAGETVDLLYSGHSTPDGFGSAGTGSTYLRITGITTPSGGSGGTDTTPPLAGSLQDAIDVTTDGDTLDVTGQTFHEQVTIDHPMTLVGGTLDGDGTRTRWIDVTAAGVTIDGTIGINCAGGADQEAGLQVSAAGFLGQNLTLSGGPYACARAWPGATGAQWLNCDMSDGPTVGLLGYQAHNSVVTGGRYHDSTGAADVGNESGGMKFGDSTGLTIRGVEADGNVGPGIWLDIDCDDATIGGSGAGEGNNAHDNSKAGIMYEIGDGALIDGNTVYRNGSDGVNAYESISGIMVSSSRNVVVSHNTAAFNNDAAAEIAFVSQNRAPLPHNGNSASGNVVRSSTGINHYTDWADTGGATTISGNTLVADSDPRIVDLA